MRASGLSIRLEDVSAFRRGVTILDRVTLQIQAGAPTVLIGPNGSGKTTLLRIVMGLEVPAQGKVIWAGGSKPPRRAFVFQRPAMLRRSVAGNLLYALRIAQVPGAEHGERISGLLTLVGLDGLASRPARRLSGGEQQRLAMARALALDPAILFLDEPTASLDPASTKAIEDVIRAAGSGGIKVVMSTHDLPQARRIAGEIVLLHQGHVIESAEVTEFFNSPKTPEASKFIAGDLLL